MPSFSRVKKTIHFSCDEDAIGQSSGCLTLNHPANALAIFWKPKSKHRGVNNGEHILQHILWSLFNQLHSA